MYGAQSKIKSDLIYLQQFSQKMARAHPRNIPVLPFLNNPKDLDPSYKMDLDFWDCFGRKEKLHLIKEEIRYLAEINRDKEHMFNCSEQIFQALLYV